MKEDRKTERQIEKRTERIKKLKGLEEERREKGTKKTDRQTERN